VPFFAITFSASVRTLRRRHESTNLLEFSRDFRFGFREQRLYIPIRSPRVQESVPPATQFVFVPFGKRSGRIQGLRERGAYKITGL